MIAKAHSENKDAKDQAINEPIIVDIGKKTRKQVRRLRNGKPGRLMSRVEETIESLRAEGTMEPGAQPVIIVIRQRSGRKGRGMAKMWGLG